MTTMIADTVPAPVGAKSVSQIGAAFEKVRNVYLGWREEQIAIAHLKGLNDHYLKDIGISRDDIEAAVRGNRKG